ncbi:MAG: GspH/FimT family protein [Gammaproteobacteria bacterium]|nr:GspH/FimT family protein [Gammaproteobacteria bacterium]
MKKLNSGFTLLELMLTMLIVVIVTTLAAPSMQSFVKNERLTSQINIVISHLMLARSEALKRNQSVILCASDNATACTTSNAKEGWIVFVDVDASGGLTGTDEVIKVQQELKGDDLYFNNFVTVVYDNRGFSPNATGTVSLCDDRGVDFAKVLSLSRTGRVRRSGAPSC